MSSFQKNSNNEMMEYTDVRVEEISSSNSFLIKSFKRNNTKTWYKDPNEDLKQNKKQDIENGRNNGLKNNYLNADCVNKMEKKNKLMDDSEMTNKIGEKDIYERTGEKDYFNTMNKFNSLNFVSSQSTNDMINSNPVENNFPITKSDFTNFSYNRIEAIEDCEIEDETITRSDNFDDDKNEYSKTEMKDSLKVSQMSQTNVAKSRSCEQEINIFKSANNLLNEFNKGNLKPGDYIYDDSIIIIRYISEGAQAKVYLGLIEEIDKYVAIKRYTLMEQDEKLIDKVISECEAVKTLEHPNIIRYFDVEINYVNSMTTIDLIMEYVEGFSLKDYILSEEYTIKKSNVEKLDKIKFIVKNLLEGISFLHNNKIIHRDLKPENIIISEDFEKIKIVDFGISTKVKDSETYKSRSLLGTPWYMAPEVILEKPYAFEADIWSIGCILFELICGVKPYYDNNPFNAMLKMAQYTSPIEYADEEIKDLFYDKCNRNLLDFLQKCWRANNIFRPSASELLEHQFLE